MLRSGSSRRTVPPAVVVEPLPPPIAQRHWFVSWRARGNSRCRGCTTLATSSCRRCLTAGSASALPSRPRRCSRFFRIPPSARHIAARSHHRLDKAGSSPFSAAAPAAPGAHRCRSAACRWCGRECRPTGAPGLGNRVARLGVNGGVEEDDRARRVIILDIVVDLLEVPGVLAGLRVQGDAPPSISS
jgi:hypothetical protein